MLWEGEFYEDGESIASRIESLCQYVEPHDIWALAYEARTRFNLRHAPLLLLKCLLKKHAGSIASDAISEVVSRPDETCELLSMYWKDGRKPLPNQLKKGLARAFTKFDRYQLAKYNRTDRAIKLRDVLFLCHPTPRDAEQAETWKMLVDGTLPSPDTWEVELSSGADKKETFERLIRENKLGYLAMLRNLRTMHEVGCDRRLVKTAILSRRGASRVMPFRFVAAARAAVAFEAELDIALLATINELPVLSGHTILLVDVSGSMNEALSARSDMTRMDAAASLASILNCESRQVFTFSNDLVEVPPRLGMAGVESIIQSQPHCGTALRHAVLGVSKIPHDRIIVITDEQSHDGVVPSPSCPNPYMINVGSYEKGVSRGIGWINLDGFSESVIRYITEIEQQHES
jgi:hypothetical protein